MNFFYEIFRKNKENLNTTFDIINYLLIVSLFILLIVDTIDFSTIMGFPKSANETMFSIIALLSEMSILLTFILFGVLIALAYIIDIYNHVSNPFPRHFEKSVESTLDVLFVVFPTIIIIYLLIPSLGFIFNNETAIETAFEIDIIGHQWYWSYEYNLSIGISLYNIFENENILFNKIEFDSLMDTETTYNRLLQVDKRVIIPVHTFIKMNITSQDVIHSWAVPQLGIKYDAIPGRLISFILSSNMLGVFYGQCSELCGVNHAFMPICIQSVEYDIFLDWFLLGIGVNPSYYIIEYLYKTV
jgi:heme/copper-type cytochrome/quinol oxidase subunit 2